MRRSVSSLVRAKTRPLPTFRTRPGFCRPNNRQLATHTISATNIQFGQPLYETHPHLLKSGELTQGISALEYHHRRAALAKELPEGSVAVLAASDLKYRSGAVFYGFHQDPNFFYLTGFNEPDAVAVIEKGSSDVEYTFHLYVRPKDPRAEQWDGARSGVQAAQDVFNADKADDIANVSSNLSKVISDAKEVYTDIRSYGSKSALARFFAGGSTGTDGFAKLLQNSKVRPLRAIMNELRVNKSVAELALMRSAGEISGAVITAAMGQTYTLERQLWADLSHGFIKGGLDGEAYIPVVAGGTNALSIHYVRNDAILNTGDVVLVDAGGETGGYITDITRTWPVDGLFSPAQRDLYAMLLEVQESCISLCHETANTSLDALHRHAENGLSRGLKDLGFDTDRPDCLETLFPHHVGHYIGLDVHDAPGLSRIKQLRENQCITIEPGVYVPVDDDRWPTHFRGLGIRIEDSIRIGKEEPEVFTTSAVKQIEDIEALRTAAI